ncbi:fimbrial biogenesis chaperone [Lelliottia nimipressuralis]|uniref:Molecular chaperone n=1 Tax=Lelliottia nimipressuralis TaxID=69220 RepID=A0ABD4KFF8_9ENTR|nr:molecular chaperone [Lelliottia nimipressuralis]MBF4180646.1 molecular chaperone [Lelliottia nimipressuralis]
MRVKHWIKNIISIISLIVLTSGTVFAGPVIGGTRIIYDGNKKEASVSIKNPEKNNVYLIQSWIDAGDGFKTKAPFIVTPPLFRIEPNDENILRIVRVGGNLPEYKESVFWLNVKSIPASTDANRNNVLQIVIKSRLKLFYRPRGLSGNPMEAYKKLIFTKNGKQLIVKNPTPYYVTFYNLNIGGTDIKEANLVPPMGSVSFNFKPTSNSKVTWKVINDFGGVSKPETNNI